jgi:hypothetical protein
MSLVCPSMQSIDVGGGRVISRSHGSAVVFSELYSTYPLKLLSPKITQDGVALVYILSYGGGLVGGDRITLSVDVGSGTILVLLSQVYRYGTDMGAVANELFDRVRQRCSRLDQGIGPLGVAKAYQISTREPQLRSKPWMYLYPLIVGSFCSQIQLHAFGLRRTTKSRHSDYLVIVPL